jgi:DNA-directed RNA polymerase specialized sigma24 family protein
LAAAESHADGDLLAAVRRGNRDAYAILYQRHVDSARRVAAYRVDRAVDVDDVVAEAFTRTFALLAVGRGPNVDFRAYLLASVRNLAMRANALPECPDEVLVRLSPRAGAGGAGDPTVAVPELAAMRSALCALKPRWREILWYTAVEGHTPTQVAAIMGLTPHAASALAARAREALRRSYLSMRPLTGEPPPRADSQGE